MLLRVGSSGVHWVFHEASGAAWANTINEPVSSKQPGPSLNSVKMIGCCGGIGCLVHQTNTSLATNNSSTSIGLLSDYHSYIQWRLKISEAVCESTSFIISIAISLQAGNQSPWRGIPWINSLHEICAVAVLSIHWSSLIFSAFLFATARSKKSSSKLPQLVQVGSYQKPPMMHGVVIHVGSELITTKPIKGFLYVTTVTTYV